MHIPRSTERYKPHAATWKEAEPLFISGGAEERLSKIVESALGPEAEFSVLEQACNLIESATGMSVNFDDYTGIMLLLSWFKVPLHHQVHHCKYCRLAKKHHDGLLLCVRNKQAINHTQIHHPRSMVGLCHLGVVDLVEPLIMNDKTIGAFYLGQVRCREWKKASMARLNRHAQRHQLQASELVRVWQELPEFSQAEIIKAGHDLRLLVKLARALLTASGINVDSLKPFHENRLFKQAGQPELPPLIRRIRAYLQEHFAEPLRVAEIAGHLGCHPVYLGQTYKKATGQSLHDYLRWLRIQYATELLSTGLFNVSEVASHCGYTEFGRFSRDFCKLEGCLPSSFLKKQVPVSNK